MPEPYYAEGTCGYHAQVMLAVMGGKPAGPMTTRLYERFMESPESKCLAEEFQVIEMFMEAMRVDTGGILES